MGIDEKILNHIYCDYQWGLIGVSNKNILFESFGQIPEIDNYVDDLKTFIEEKIFPHIKDGGTYAEQITSPSVFYSVKNPFFTACKIGIIVSIRDGNMSWGSYYNQDDSFFSDKCGYVEIKITVGASSCEQALSLVLGNFAHELTHAYDDFRYSKNGGTLKSAVKKSNYEERLAVITLGKNVQQILGKILYILSPIERNAIIGQISAEIRNESVRSPKEALEAIKKTTAYSRYTLCKNGVEYLNGIDNIMDKTSLLIAYTKWVGYNKRTNKNPESGYDVRKNLTYEGFLSELNSMFKKWEHKFLNSIGKIAYMQYMKTAAPLVNESSYTFDSAIFHKQKNIVESGFEWERNFYYDFDKLIDREE